VEEVMMIQQSKADVLDISLKANFLGFGTFNLCTDE
jgi:hypothetical protein